MNRRDFLAAGLVSILPSLPSLSFAASVAASYRRLLVLVELKGGNDGLNTVVPYSDDAYYRLRPRIGLARDSVLPLDERTALHPSLAPLMPLWQAAELAIVQGVGYPEPNLSHFRSIDIWDTASRSNEYLQDGWLARAFAKHPAPRDFAADGVSVGGSDLGPLSGPGSRALAISEPQQFLRQAQPVSPSRAKRNAALEHILKVEADIAHAAAQLDASATFRTEFPRGRFGQAVRTAAQLAASRAPVAAIRISLPGFDTHQGQLQPHARLLGELAEGLAALRGALTEIDRWRSTLVLTYSEFGRRPQENGNQGTDHGTAASHFAAGGLVRGGLYGAAPSLGRLEGGNLAHAVDFRALYASVLERWWGLPSAAILGKPGAEGYAGLEFLALEGTSPST
jgi:uncharacterized protein (DUF1501 family)